MEKELDEIKGVGLDLGCGSRPYENSVGRSAITVDIDLTRDVDVVADAHRLPFKDGSFDYIVCTEVLEHLYHPHIAIDEMCRLLRPNGKLILTTRFIFPIHDKPYDYFRYTRYGLRMLFKNWEDIKIQPQHSGFMTFIVLFERLIMEQNAFLKVLSPLIVSVAIIATWFDRVISLIIPDDYITSGYFLAARKPKGAIEVNA
ncbi:MAG: class I SAM-dependent methyltransferase [Candidatus Ranarchaeia archaeon]